jgi:RNA polymerase sigma-70 factor (ECF subfamily)
VLAVIYLVYNAGLGRAGEASELCLEGIRLPRLMHALMPDEPEVAGLLSLLLLDESRRAARLGPEGELVLLRDQVRAHWDPNSIQEGQAILRACIERDSSGPYQIQAAIQAVHADACCMQSADWPQIVALYDELLHMLGTPIVALNRAIAVGEVAGPQAGLQLVDDLELGGYYLLHSTRADFLQRMGRAGEAAQAYGKAAELAPTEGERAFLLELAKASSKP